MSDEKPAVDKIYLAALELPDQERGIFLDQVCAGHPDIKARVQKLLKAHQQAGDCLVAAASELHSSVVELNETAASGSQSPANVEKSAPLARTEPGRVGQGQGDRIGPYQLQKKIGEGGMGEVWVAKQTEPVKRKVAVKLIKAGMDTRAVLLRFEQERQVLALMNHPNIAGVLDGGMTPSGQPFFVMELVNGLPLTEYCDKTSMTLRARLGGCSRLAAK